MIVILNASAGSSLRCSPEHLAALFGQQGIAPRIMIAENGKEVCSLARKASEGEDDPIVAGGGDGTISTVAQAIFSRGKTLGVLPLGTLNHFAKDLKIPLDLEGAVRNAASGYTQQFDVGEVNGQIFLNNSNLGLYPEIVRRRDKELEKFNLGKWRAFLRAMIAVFRRYRFLQLHIKTEETEFRRTTPFLFVGNNEYSLDAFGLGGRKAVTSGRLCFWLARRTRPLGLFYLGLRALFGQLRGARDFEAFCGNTFEVTTGNGAIRVALDGETMLLQQPLRYRSLPRSLRVIVPKEAG